MGGGLATTPLYTHIMSKKDFIIKIIDDNIFYGNDFKISLKDTNFPSEDSKFKTGLVQYWLTEIVDYDSYKNELSLNIVDYHFPNEQIFLSQKPKTQLNYIKFLNLKFYSIEPVLFCYRKYDFIGIATDMNIDENEDSILNNNLEFYSHKPEITSSKEISETVNIDFDDIKFDDDKIIIRITPSTFENYSNYSGYELKSDFSKKEFQVVHKYFKKYFGEKIEIQARFLYDDFKCEIIEILSPALSNFDSKLINEIRYDYTLNEIKSKRDNKDKRLLLLSDFLKEKEAIIKEYSPQEFINTLLIKSSLIHNDELKYLTELHNKTNKHNLEFVITPEFGFLFYIETNNKYNFILETYKINKATYIWSKEKNEADYHLGLFYETIKYELAKLFEIGRINYRKSHTYKLFTYIEHSNLEATGFNQWKEKLEYVIDKF